jgi:hypothetical protein
MKRISFLLLFLSTSVHAAYNFGNGSDNCNWSGGATLTKAEYNCLTVTIGAAVTVDSSVTDPVVIRSLGDVQIDAQLSVNGVDGSKTPGPGGTAGADCTATSPAACDDVHAPGSTGGEGQGANVANGAATGGGGGTGGRYGTAILPTVGSSGADPFGSGNVGTSNPIPPSNFGDENNFETSFRGGVGGGAGSSGYDLGTTGRPPGGDGGGGGGAIKIIAKGNITISASGSITAKGANGEPGSANLDGGGGAGGGGGGGTGGSIFIISLGSITVESSGSVEALGGTGGVGGTDSAQAANGGAGGNGGSGRIRFDSLTGAYSGSGTVNPTPVQKVATPPSAVFESDIAYNCAAKEKLDEWPAFIFTFIFGFVFILPLGWIVNRMGFRHHP